MKHSEPTNVDLNEFDIPLFRNLTAEHLRELSSLIHRKSFSANTTLMTAEQAGEVVYLILGGTVKVHIEQADGGDVIVAILGPGEIIGEMSALGQAIRSASVVTIESSTLLWMDRTNFQRCLMTMPMLAYNLACILATRLRLANEKIQTLATQSVESRVARQILAFAEQYGQRRPDGNIYVGIRLTQSDIAALIGASREHINKVIVSYKERGYLSVDRNYRITIHDQNALARRC
ncbi:MAG TPA: Crp/Fnr family transcriptional regulator [Blastocatellia bacterium]|nr:Crp/Fnr family transcriptional regulator [Blastocatellia bacterium]